MVIPCNNFGVVPLPSSQQLKVTGITYKTVRGDCHDACGDSLQRRWKQPLKNSDWKTTFLLGR